MEFVSPFTADQRLEASADNLPTQFSMADDSLFDDSLDDEFHSKVLKAPSSRLDDSICGVDQEEGGATESLLRPPASPSPLDSKSSEPAPSLVPEPERPSPNGDSPMASHSLQASSLQEVPVTNLPKKASGKVVPCFGKKKPFVPPAAKSTPQSKKVNAKTCAVGKEKEEEEEEEEKSIKDSVPDLPLLKVGSDSDSARGERREIESKEEQITGSSEGKEIKRGNQKRKREEQEARKLEREERKRERELKKLEKEEKKAEKERQKEEKRLELERKRAEREQSRKVKGLKRKMMAVAKESKQCATEDLVGSGSSSPKGETSDLTSVTPDPTCIKGENGDTEGEEVTGDRSPAGTVSSPFKQSPARDTMAEIESEADNSLQHEKKSKEADRKQALALTEKKALSLSGTNQASAIQHKGTLDSARKPRNMCQDKRKEERAHKSSQQPDGNTTGKSSSKGTKKSTKYAIPSGKLRADEKGNDSCGSPSSECGERGEEESSRVRKRSKPRNFSGPVWVQCTKCDKWRQLGACQDPTVLPEDWECSMDSDPTYNSCSAAEEPWSDPGDSQEFVESPFVPGSIVWAKMDGYPWWPAMVEEDPDEETYFRMEDGSLIPVEYHVVFFDTPVSRVWVNSCHLQQYTAESDMNKEHKLMIPYKYRRGLRGALKMALRASQLGILERLAAFTFSKRFKEGRGATVAGKKRRHCDTERRGARKSARRNSGQLVAGKWLSGTEEKGDIKTIDLKGGGQDGEGGEGGGEGAESENDTAMEAEVDVVS